jgi:hypothetical protein
VRIAGSVEIDRPASQVWGLVADTVTTPAAAIWATCFHQPSPHPGYVQNFWSPASIPPTGMFGRLVPTAMYRGLESAVCAVDRAS